MATRKNDQNGEKPAEAREESTATDMTEAITFGPKDGGNTILAAWDFLYWVFGARVERFDPTPEGIYAVNFRVREGYDPRQIVADMHPEKDRRIELIPTYLWVQGEEPEKLTDSQAMTQTLTQFFRSDDGSGSRSPDYAKKAIQEYKREQGIEKPRGRQPGTRTVKIEQLGSLNEAQLADVPADDVAKLAELFARLAKNKRQETAVGA